MTKDITESQFYMWRTIFAVAHADNIVTNEEIRFMVEVLEDIPFSEAQRRILTEDIAEPQDIEEMFDKIGDYSDQAAFFDFARKIVWADGDFGKAERDIILKLKEKHIKAVDVDELVGGVEMEFEDDHRDGDGSVQAAVYSSRDSFMKRLFKTG